MSVPAPLWERPCAATPSPINKRLHGCSSTTTILRRALINQVPDSSPGQIKVFSLDYSNFGWLDPDDGLL